MNSKNTAYYLNAMGLCCAVGGNKDEVAKALFNADAREENLRDFLQQDKNLLQESQACYLGKVPAADLHNDAEKGLYASRNNHLLMLAYAQIQTQVEAAIEQYGKDRVAVVLGTSTSGMSEGEDAFFQYKKTGKFPDDYSFSSQEIADGAEFLARHLGLSNIATSIATACSSSSKAIAYGEELISAGICDAAIIGGVDSLCRMTVNGFHSLGALSSERCNPFSKNRNGISIGEAAAVFLLTTQISEIRLMSVGESSDAHSFTGPEPEGVGAEQAMLAALEKAGVPAADISYVNLHGTATEQNDSMEAKAVMRVFGEAIPCSSTKGLTGHTLGAAGALEAALCWLMLSKEYNPQRLLLPQIWDKQKDEAIALQNFVDVGDKFCGNKKPSYALSNSFAFGGSNAVILLKGEDS